MYYATELGGTLKPLKIANLSSYDSLRPLGNSEISSGSSVYQPQLTAITWSASGTFPDVSGTSSVSYSTLVNTFSGSRCYSTSGIVGLYESEIESAYTSARGTATSFELSTNSTQYFYLYSNDGDYLNMSFTLNPQGDYNTPATGIWNLSDNYSGTYRQSYSLSSGSTFADGSFCFCRIANLLGVLMFTRAGLNLARYISVYFATLTYQQDNSISPFYWMAVNGGDSLTVPSSGSTRGESDGDSDSGYGSFSFDNDDISTDADMPTSSLYTGLINPYYVTAGEIATLGTFLWSDSFFDNIAKTFSNPMDCIISLSSFPLASSSMSLGSSESVRVGNTTSSSTGTRLISEFVTIDCGTVSVPEVWGSYLDYAQTKLYIYIPYLGIEELPLCECMGGSVACSLRINLLTGALVACVTLTSGTYVTGSARVQPIYFSTTCKSDIPVSGATTGALAGAFQLLGGAVSSVAGIATGVAPLAISGLASAAQGVATMQSQNSQISGAVGAAGGQMAHKIPFLIFDRPVQSVPANLASVAGYQSNSGTTLSRCSGFVICDTINLDGLALTRSELEEVEQICTSGVYIS